MAGDWIKMRVSLTTHPKVLMLAENLSYEFDYQEWSGLSGFVPGFPPNQKTQEEELTQALRVTRYVTVTALLKFWGYANEHAKGEFIPGLRISNIDEIAQVPGFGKALESIGWAIYEDNETRRGVYLPNFTEHNATASDRTAAARQKRYRDKKKQESRECDATGDVTRNVTVTDREEKRREEKNKDNKGRFTPPTLTEVSDYCQSRGNDVDPQRFLDHYEANGWMRGKNKIKDWKACVRTWEQKTEKSDDIPETLRHWV